MSKEISENVRTGKVLYKDLSEKDRDIEEVAFEAIIISPVNFKFASERLRLNVDFIKKCTYIDARIVEYVSSDLMEAIMKMDGITEKIIFSKAKIHELIRLGKRTFPDCHCISWHRHRRNNKIHFERI